MSVIIAALSLIPIFGAWIGAATGAFLIVFQSPIKALTFLIFLLILQQVEGNLIYPKVVGKSVGLPGCPVRRDRTLLDVRSIWTAPPAAWSGCRSAAARK